MADEATSRSPDLLEMTAKVVANHLANNAVEAKDIPSLIREVYMTLASLEGNEGRLNGQKPAVPVAESVKPDFIVCLEDGKRLKMLKRYLRTKYNLSPEEYRKRWDLPPDYPLVAPNYAQKRQALARSMGLGKHR
ncbi:MAG TPA: MucR family transcriptional regulator [Sphingomonadales bacterium]|nr:MucR family transcriptional regulator [Sphingomonadales bacterium]